MIKQMETIAYIKSEYGSKFGIPRQSGLENTLKSYIVFEEKYRDENALRGIEGFSHLWILWYFSKADVDGKWSPTVRPPKMGGNKRMGVFATRSPFRPNGIGLSSVKLEEVKKTDEGTVLVVSGADLLDGTPIFDIKPYLKYTDSHEDAVCGFADEVSKKRLEVRFNGFDKDLDVNKAEAIKTVLSLDPRPGYDNDESEHGFEIAGYEIGFTVKDDVVTVTRCSRIKKDDEGGI